MQISQMKEFLLHNREAQKVIPEDTLGKLAFLDTDLIDQEQFPQLSCIPEINSTGQKLSHYHVLKFMERVFYHKITQVQKLSTQKFRLNILLDRSNQLMYIF